ncbi:MAG: ATP-binding protein [Chitinophagaceae bacterium]
MKSLSVVILLLLLNPIMVDSQIAETDSLKRLLAQASPDTTRVVLLNRLAGLYRFNKPDSAIILIQQGLQLARKLNYTRGEVRALSAFGEALRFQGEYPTAMATEFEALRISRNSHDPEPEATSLTVIGSIYIQLNEFQQGLSYFRRALKINERLEQTNILALSSIGDAYEKMNQLDSASFYQEQAYSRLKALPRGNLASLVTMRLGILQARLGNTAAALGHYHYALANANLMGDLLNRGRVQYQIAELYYQLKQPDSSLAYARQAFITCQQAVQKSWQVFSSNLLVKLYRERDNLDSAFYYQQVATALKDSLYGPEKFQRLQLLTSMEQLRQQEILQAQERFKNKIKLYALLAAVLVFLFLAIILYRNNRQKQKSNVELRYQKSEIQNTLTELKATQAQLIQSEKMASLGELTAGIAHEIQNPLNFVNNFSEVNKELIGEMKTEIGKGNLEEVKLIADDIEANEEKISHHGKRADAIVKGMLQHSSSSSGVKEPTDINAMCDEYLRLSYHGLRSKDKEFNATMQTDFDKSIGKINIIPQDIGRVLLNLYNNAFYVVNEKKKQQGDSCEPAVSVSTKKIGDKIEIMVRDNGNGIPQKIVDKIFQPFFTTKPTGQGTGLGLSLSYDIIKAHGGQLKVETKEGQETVFIIQLPTVF